MKTNTMKTKYIIGSVSSGTMHEEDLIPAFLDCLEHFNPDIKEHYKDELAEIEAIEDEDEKMDAMSMFLNEDLFNALEQYAPPYFYFGSHPGDGSDYGFWLCEEALEEFDGLKVSDLSEVPADYSGEVLHVNDHGNTSLYSATRGKLEAIWELV